MEENNAAFVLQIQQMAEDKCALDKRYSLPAVSPGVSVATTWYDDVLQQPYELHSNEGGLAFGHSEPRACVPVIYTV